METVFVFCLLVVIAAATSVPRLPPPTPPPVVLPTSGRGCRYILGRCVEECPENTHAYSTGCGKAISQRTCDEPKSRELGEICDLSRCDCDEPLVLDKASDKCVLESDCPKSVPIYLD